MQKLTHSQSKLLRSLTGRHGRKKTGKIIVEGIRTITTMLDCKVVPEFAVVRSGELNDQGQSLIKSLENQKVPIFSSVPKEFAEYTSTVHSQGVIAVTDRNKFNVPDSVWQKARLVVYLDGIADPGNLGTIIRTCAAFGVSLIAISPDSADISNPKVLRASAGAIFAQPVVIDLDAETLTSFLESNEMELYGCVADGEIDIESLELPHRLCLALGSEATGLSSRIAARCQGRIRLDMSQHVESLNVATAGAIIIYRLAKRMNLL